MRALMKPKLCFSNGFTLVELSLVILISAIITGAILFAFQNYQKILEREQTLRAIQNAQNGIVSFFAQVSRYPCPANPTLTPADNNYGKEDCTLTPVPGKRDADGDGALDDVLVGTFPVYAVNEQLPPDDQDYFIYMNEGTSATEGINPNLSDAWNDKLTYAVTKSLTVAKDPTRPTAFGATYDKRLGAIALVDEYDRPTGGIKNNAQYAIVSHGKDRMGAVNTDGVITVPCDPAYTAQNENCNNDSKFREALMSNSDTSPATFYDDYVVAEYEYDSSLWGNTLDSVSREQTQNIRNLNSGNVGVKTTTPTERLDINGNLKIDNTAVINEACDNSGDPANCFRPFSLYNLNCGTAGTYMKQVQIVMDGNSVSNSRGELTPGTCQTLRFDEVPHAAVTCPATRPYLQGLYTDGSPVCVRFDTTLTP